MFGCPCDLQAPRKFYPSLQNNGRSNQRKLALEAADEVTSRNIKKVGVRFIPGAAFRKMLEEVKFEKTE